MKRRRAAHFISWPYLLGNPSNRALISALVESGYDVDVFSSDPGLDVSMYGERVRARAVEYGYRWIIANVLRPSWARYSLFSGTTEEPMAVAGLLARIFRKRCVTMADEIKSGSTSGSRSARWKSLCRFGMRASDLTIVNARERVAVQREYAGLGESQSVIVMPNAFVHPPAPGDRRALRLERGIPQDAFVACYSGVFSTGNGGLWFAQALAECRDTWFWGQVVPQEHFAGELLPWLEGRERLVLEPGPLGWDLPSASMPAADVGIVIYLQDAPQFLNMGIASTRLCMFLSMGVPVVASRQESFRFIEDYDCGLLVDSAPDFVRAIGKIREDLPRMRANARRCAAEYIDAKGHYERLVHTLKKLG